MEKQHIKELIVRVIILFVGLTIAHLGVTLFLLANMGSDPYNVLIQGLFRTEQRLMNISWLTHGRVHVVISFLIIIVLFFVDKSYLKIGTIICMTCGGPIIDFFLILLEPLFEAFPVLWFKIPMLAAGCIILAYGMTIVIKSNAGTGPNDLVSVVLSDKTHWKFTFVRIGTDAAFVILGFILGGSFGVGTIICTFLVSPVAGFFLPRNERIIEKIVSRIR